MLGTATIIRSACSATGLPLFSQRRSSGGEEDRRCSQARNGGSAGLSTGSLTHSPLGISVPADRSREGPDSARLTPAVGCRASVELSVLVLHTVIHRCAQNVRRSVSAGGDRRTPWIDGPIGQG